MDKVPRIGIGVAIAGALILAACASRSTATLKAPENGGHIGGEIPTVTLDSPLVFPMPALCTTGGSITVTNVTADDAAGGLHVVDWGTRRRFPGDGYTPADNGGAADGLVTQFRGFGHQPVTARCGQSKVSDELDSSAALHRPEAR